MQSLSTHRLPPVATGGSAFLFSLPAVWLDIYNDRRTAPDLFRVICDTVRLFATTGITGVGIVPYCCYHSRCQTEGSQEDFDSYDGF